MLFTASRLHNTPIMGLHTGTELGRFGEPIIDPHTLEIVAYEVIGSRLDHTPSLLRIADIRELGNIGAIIDSSDEFVSPDDVIRLGKIYKLHFTPVGMKVIDRRSRHIGKAIDFTVDVATFVIQQLIVRRPVLKSLNDSELLIHRSQIKEISDTRIIIDSEMKHTAQASPDKTTTAYVNPFRARRPEQT